MINRAELPAKCTRYALVSFDRQFFLADLIGEHGWHIDLHSGMLTFASRCRWQTQLLGTESELSGTWLWAWANIESNIPARLLVASLALKAHGEQHGIPELTTPQIPLDQIDGNTLALLASGFCEANAYYRCPYEGGALYVLIMDENFPKCTDPPLQRIATVFPQAIAFFDIPDHKLALAGYLDSYNLGYEQDRHKIVVKENGEPVLTATFDEQNRLTNLDAELKAKPVCPGESSSGKSWDEGQLRRMLGG